MAEDAAATWTPSLPASARRQRSAAPATSAPCPSWTSRFVLPPSSPSSRSASARGRSSESSQKTIGATWWAPVAPLARRPPILRRRELARLEHGVEPVTAGERHRAGSPPPQAPATPDRQRHVLDRRHQRVPGQDPVEDQRPRRGLRDRRPQAGAEPARPAPVVSGPRAAVGGHVLDRKAEVPRHRGRLGEGEEERLDPRAQAPGDGHRAGHVAEAGAVRGHEQDPSVAAHATFLTRVAHRSRSRARRRGFPPVRARRAPCGSGARAPHAAGPRARSRQRPQPAS